MSLKPRYVAATLLAGGAAASIAVAPIAVAHIPRAGDQNARDTIAHLEAEGYNVRINWVMRSLAPLSMCSVNAVRVPDRSRDSAETFTTVYVDVSCPSVGE
ncbi:hypothetical protein [Mycobacterium sp. 29Ha]|uniref:hypothetical protein n=1 Tax=Mycobacterium sp. 29Ha TaxID=2939268 RepID=UPI002938E355|nr:hypothetical protein [Mycobacterium sp. 29Ha]MDV3131927.1 hypothetical protein [Mycobacterium sp. 29Ha]